MDYKYIELLMERYFNAETSLEEESILRTFFSQKDIPADLEQWRPLFTSEATATLGDDFDSRILAMTEGAEAGGNSTDSTPAMRHLTLTQRLMPLFRAAAVVAILLTIGGALQAPWDKSWNTTVDYASYQHELDSVEVVSPVQAENIGESGADSTSMLMQALPKD